MIYVYENGMRAAWDEIETGGVADSTHVEADRESDDECERDARDRELVSALDLVRV